MSPHQWDRMGRNDSRRHNECVRRLTYLSSLNVTPVEMILRPAENSVDVQACVTICKGVEGLGRAFKMHARWQDPYDFTGCVCSH